MTTFGATIRNARELVGLTQLQLAERLGVTQQAVTQWEAGANLQERTLRRVADALGCDVELLLQKLEDE